MDPDGYPEEKELQTIRDWPYEDFYGLLDYVRARWMYPDYFTVEEGVVYVSTGGWSGNEDLIRALKDNAMFWLIHWCETRRGGHYVFSLPGWRLELEEASKWRAVRREGQ